MHKFQGQACCFACVVWTVPLEHILSQPLGVHARLMSHNAFMKRSLLSEVCGGGTVVLYGCWVPMLFHCTTQILRSQSLHTSPKTHQSPWRRQNHQSTQRPSEPQESTEPPKHAKPPEVPRAPGNPKSPRAPQTRRTEKSPQRNQPEPPDPCDMTSAPGAPTHTTLPLKKTQLFCCLRIDGTLNEKRASVTACACVLEFNTKLLHVHLYS